MDWKEKMDEWGGGEITFLSEDGECITFIVVGEPHLIEGKFKGKTTERIGCPVIGVDGFTLLIIGKRLARRLAKHEGIFSTNSFTIVRHGAHDDITTKYELSVCNDNELTKRLLDYAKSEFEVDAIAEAIKYAEEVANN